MKKCLLLLVALCLGVSLITAQGATTAPTPSKAPGAEIATAISTITGVAISPLLGTGVYGAMKYYRTAPEKRAALPWFARPTFWMPALLLVAFVAAKDILGTAAPASLKKPFDIAEAIENKVSGLVALGIFVPFMAMIFSDQGADTARLSSLGLAALDFSWLGNALAVPVAMAAFVVVWLVGNAINVLIVLSPFTSVDLALKSARLAVLATIPATAWLNPWIGAIWAVVVIIASWFLAGWSLRLSHFGTVFIWDLVTFRRQRFTTDATANKLFLARTTNEVPARTYGKLSRNETGQLVLKYRPWLVLPERSLTLPEGKYEAGRGLFYSEILRVEGEAARTILLLPPRYRGHEAELVSVYGLTGTREVGFRAAWKWLKDLFGDSPVQPVPA